MDSPLYVSNGFPDLKDILSNTLEPAAVFYGAERSDFRRPTPTPVFRALRDVNGRLVHLPDRQDQRGTHQRLPRPLPRHLKSAADPNVSEE